MTGRISEESNEAYNGTLAETKSSLLRIPITSTRVQTITSQTHGNLKGVILEPQLAIKKETRGNKREPYKQRVMRLDGRHVRLSEGVCVQFDR